MNRTSKSTAYVSVNNESKAVFMKIKSKFDDDVSSADVLLYLCKFFVNNYDKVLEMKDSELTEAQLHNKIVPYRNDIKLVLDNFELRDEVLIERDINRIMWNVDGLIKLIKGEDGTNTIVNNTLSNRRV